MGFLIRDYKHILNWIKLNQIRYKKRVLRILVINGFPDKGLHWGNFVDCLLQICLQFPGCWMFRWMFRYKINEENTILTSVSHLSWLFEKLFRYHSFGKTKTTIQISIKTQMCLDWLTVSLPQTLPPCEISFMTDDDCKEERWIVTCFWCYVFVMV